MASVPNPVLLNLRLPVIDVSLGETVTPFAFMTMPETAMHKNHCAPRRKNDIWLTWQVFAMKTVTIA
jgi:hypothetical protein